MNNREFTKKILENWASPGSRNEIIVTDDGLIITGAVSRNEITGPFESEDEAKDATGQIGREVRDRLFEGTAVADLDGEWIDEHLWTFSGHLAFDAKTFKSDLNLILRRLAGG